MCSYLSQDMELRVVQHYVGADGQTVVREHQACLQGGAKLPSYVLEDAEMTELCVRARGDEDWSQDVRLERKERGGASAVVQVFIRFLGRCGALGLRTTNDGGWTMGRLVCRPGRI